MPTKSPNSPWIRIPLYHGTSTLFLNSIIEFGLGGRNLIAEWKILEFAKVIYPLVEKHLSARDDLMLKCQTFRFMVEQKSAAMNFQHGDTYLSPAPITAIRYAADNRYGSELLTYTLDLLNELVHLKIAGVCDKLYRAYPHIFEKLDVSPAPLLIRVDDISPTVLVAENGGDAQPVWEHIEELTRDFPSCDAVLQQSNFRLRVPVSVVRSKIWLINVAHWNHPALPEYSLHLLSIGGECCRDAIR